MTASQPLLLMTPGPTRVPDRVLRAGARPMIHHRSPDFSEVLGRLVRDLGPIFGTAGTVLPVHTSGRGGMEASIANLFSPGDELVACTNGKFGELWAQLARSYGLRVHCVATDWNIGVDLDVLAGALAEHPHAKAVTLAFSDTSTGVRNDVPAVASIARERGMLVLVDGISGIGGMRFDFDGWGIDAAVTASQKCLMSSAGLSFVALSARAWAAAERATLPRSYWDFRAIAEALSRSQPQTPGSAPVHLMLQVAEAVRMIHEEGLPEVYARHERMAASVRERVTDLGFVPQCPALPEFSSTLTAVAAPEGVDPRAIREGLMRHGIMIAGGLGPFQESAFRIGHLGDIRPADVTRTLDALESVLSGLIRPRTAGRGVAG